VAGAGVRPFPFSRVFDGEKDQRHVYEACAGPCVSAVLNGLNACVLAYGQTGSGKTHTTFGPPRALELPGGGLGSDAKPEADGVGGVVPRCVAELLRARVEGVEIKVAMQYVEIYNDQCFDLLTGEVCFVRRDDGSLRGAVEAPLNTYDDAVRLLRVGDVRRRFAATAMNSRSSRSHAVVVLSVRQAQLHSGLVLESTLHLVDLAGSERLKKSMATGLRKQEATGINSSLLVLGKVVAALVEGKKHVPYLESTLTTLLRAALGGASRTTALVCCRRDDGHADETLQALRFGKR
ncbi:P-loop containing nucleoside triphosphate hydrolase protein, partial [Pelagophyceae sp. CCMP2097]